MTEAINRLRDLLGDNLTQTQEVQEYLGGSKVFNLEYASISSATLVVYKNGAVFLASNYTYSSATGKITITGTLASGDQLTFEYQAYFKYSDNELKGYIRSALYYLAVEKYRVFTAKSDDIIFPTPSEAECSLIAIIAAILIKGHVKSYRTPEFTIVFDTENMSIEKKIRYTLKSYKHTYGVVTYIDLTKESAASEED